MRAVTNKDGDCIGCTQFSLGGFFTNEDEALEGVYAAGLIALENAKLFYDVSRNVI